MALTSNQTTLLESIKTKLANENVAQLEELAKSKEECSNFFKKILVEANKAAPSATEFRKAIIEYAKTLDENSLFLLTKMAITAQINNDPQLPLRAANRLGNDLYMAYMEKIGIDSMQKYEKIKTDPKFTKKLEELYETMEEEFENAKVIAGIDKPFSEVFRAGLEFKFKAGSADLAAASRPIINVDTLENQLNSIRITGFFSSRTAWGKAINEACENLKTAVNGYNGIGNSVIPLVNNNLIALTNEIANAKKSLFARFINFMSAPFNKEKRMFSVAETTFKAIKTSLEPIQTKPGSSSSSSDSKITTATSSASGVAPHAATNPLADEGTSPRGTGPGAGPSAGPGAAAVASILRRAANEANTTATPTPVSSGGTGSGSSVPPTPPTSGGP